MGQILTPRSILSPSQLFSVVCGEMGYPPNFPHPPGMAIGLRATTYLAGGAEYLARAAERDAPLDDLVAIAEALQRGVRDSDRRLAMIVASWRCWRRLLRRPRVAFWGGEWPTHLTAAEATARRVLSQFAEALRPGPLMVKGLWDDDLWELRHSSAIPEAEVRGRFLRACDLTWEWPLQLVWHAQDEADAIWQSGHEDLVGPANLLVAHSGMYGPAVIHNRATSPHVTDAAAEIRSHLQAALGLVEGLGHIEGKTPGVKAEPATRRHGPDFRQIFWDGAEYNFTAAQAAVVRQLWDAAKNGTPDVGHDVLLLDAGLRSQRLVDVFKGCLAWGTLIVQGKTRGTSRLIGSP